MRHELALYRADQVRALDQWAIEAGGISAEALMARAGRRVFDVIRARWPEVRSISVCCGGGNNGGDGWVVARLALDAGFEVQVYCTKPPSELSGAAQSAYLDYHQHPKARAIEGPSEPFEPSGALIVDAMLGIGFSGLPDPVVSQCIDAIHASGRGVIAVDVPSGLVADTGHAPGACVQADVTVSFIGQKRGLFTGQASRYVGQQVFAALEIEPDVFSELEPDAWLLREDDLRRELPKRPKDAHKGNFGHVCILGGAPQMAGAPVLSALGALHAGSGKVSVWGSHASVSAALAKTSALMARDVFINDEWQAPDFEADVLAIGPGLGTDESASALLVRAWQFAGPVVVDADGLNLLAKAKLGPADHPRILTPHPAEAGRLLGVDTQAIESDRFGAARAIAERYGCWLVLKGAGSLVAAPEGAVAVCPYGTPAMASAGMGDVLTGIVAGLCAQGLPAFEAAKLGVLIHALAGEAKARGRRQITAEELIYKIAEVMDLTP